MLSLAEDPARTIVLQVNDFNPEFTEATAKLSQILGRELQPYILLDKQVKEAGKNKPDTDNLCKTILCDFNDNASLTEALLPLRDRLLVVNASSERNQPYYQKLIPHIPFLNTPTETSLTWTTHKDLMRQLLTAHDSSLSPTAISITKANAEDALDRLKDARYPVASKPAGLAVSLLVRRADSFDELTSNITETFTAIDEIYEKNHGRGEPRILVEEFMTGDMYSVDAYVNGSGEVWHLPPIKVTTAASIGLDGYYGYQQDSDHGLDGKKLASLNKAAASAVHALKLRNSVAHIELFDTSGGWKIIELGPRAGGFRQDLYWLAYDIDHALNELLLKVGLDPDVSAKAVRSSSALMLYGEEEGVIRSVEGTEEASKLPGVHRLTLYSHPGDEVIFCSKGGTCSLDGIVYGESRIVTDRLMQQIRETIKIKVEE